MKHVILFLFLLSAILVTGCSDDKKEEAARLEQELMGGDSAQSTESPAMTPDSMSPTKPAPTREPGAIPSERQVNLPGKPAGAGYAVQVAGCEDAKYADYLVGVYKSRGYEPYVTQANVGGTTYYRVRIGLFDTMSEARTLQAELQDKYSITPWIDFVS